MARRTLTSFRYAGRGLRWALVSQPNLRLEVLAGVLAVIVAVALRFTVVELAITVVCIAMVISAELVNSAIEVLIDHAWPEQHPVIGRAKDVSAAAVLFASIGAAFVGLLLVARHLFHLA